MKWQDHSKDSLKLFLLTCILGLIAVAGSCSSERFSGEGSSEDRSPQSNGFSYDVLRSPEFRDCLTWVLLDHKHDYTDVQPGSRVRSHSHESM